MEVVGTAVEEAGEVARPRERGRPSRGRPGRRWGADGVVVVVLAVMEMEKMVVVVVIGSGVSGGDRDDDVDGGVGGGCNGEGG